MIEADLVEFRQIQVYIFNSFSFSQNFSSSFKVYFSKRLSQLFKSPLGFMGPHLTRTNGSLIQTGNSGITFSPGKFEFFVTGKVRILLWIRLLLQLIALQIALVLPFRKKFSQKTKFNLFFSLSPSQIAHNGSITDLLTFLQEPRFEMNSKFDFYLVEGKSPKYGTAEEKCLVVTRNIPIYLARNFFSYRERFKLILLNFSKLITISRSVKSSPINLLGSGALFEESIYQLFFKIFPNVTLFTTPSQFTLQPIAFELQAESKQSRRIMMHYSANTIPFRYSNPSVGKPDESIYACASIDEQWVWTEEHGSYLSRLNQKPSIVKGSMMFYSPITKNPKLHAGGKKILLFDVTPQDLEEAGGTMYSLENMRGFITDIVDVVQELGAKQDSNFEILLKPKRKYSKIHSIPYYSFLQEYKSADLIHLLDPELDIYSIIQDSDVVICIPFTSPAIIANEMGIPSCYYTSMEEVTLPEISNGSQVIRSTQVLSQFLVNSLGLTQNLALDEY